MAGKKHTLPEKPQDNSRNKLIYSIVVVILTIIALISGKYNTEYSQNQENTQNQNITVSDAEFQVHVMDVGQGDSILISADGQTLLIDAAESGESGKIISYLNAQGITELDCAAATHMHADHIGGFPKVFASVKPRAMIEPVFQDSLIPTTKTYEKYLDAVASTGAEYKALKTGDAFTLGNAQITVLAPVSEHASSLNNSSLVLRVQYDDIVCLFTGDMETPEEKTILSTVDNSQLKATFLKAGHHGSDTSSGEAFLEQVQPEYVAISCGVDNKYGHPAESTLEHLRNYTDKIYITAQQGDIVFLYDKDTKSCNVLTSGKEQKNS